MSFERQILELQVVCVRRISKSIMHDSTYLHVIKVSILEIVHLLCSFAVCFLGQRYILIEKHIILISKYKIRKLYRN